MLSPLSITCPTCHALAGTLCPGAVVHRARVANAPDIETMMKQIAGDSFASPDAIIWRDAFCYECETSECMRGTALQLAQHCFDLGWSPTISCDLNCPACIDRGMPPTEAQIIINNQRMEALLT